MKTNRSRKKKSIKKSNLRGGGDGDGSWAYDELCYMLNDAPGFSKDIKNALIKKRRDAGDAGDMKKFINWRFRYRDITFINGSYWNIYNWENTANIRAKFKCSGWGTPDKMAILKKVLIFCMEFILARVTPTAEIISQKLYEDTPDAPDANKNIVIGSWNVTLDDIIFFIKICIQEWWDKRKLLRPEEIIEEEEDNKVNNPININV